MTLSKEIYAELYKLYIEQRSDWRASWEKYGKEEVSESPEGLRRKFQRMMEKRGDPSVAQVLAGERVSSSLDDIKDEEFENVEFDDETVKTHITETEDRVDYICHSKRIRNREDLIEFSGLNMNIWKLETFEIGSYEAWRKERKVKWEVSNGQTQYGRVDDSGRILIVPVVTTRGKFVLRKKDEFWTEDTIKKLFLELQTEARPIEIGKSNSVKESLQTLVVPIADLHLGLMSTMEVNGEIYNMDIAEELVHEFVGEILERVSNRKFKKVILLAGNDFLNTDNLGNSTTAGTPQDSHAFWFEIMTRAELLLKSVISALVKVADVEVINVVSNHDKHSMWSIMKMLAAHYGSDNRVTIETNVHDRKYARVGKNLLCFTHTMKLTDAEGHVLTEGHKHLSECKRYIWFLAHLHRAVQYENQGRVELYRLPTFSGVSRWAKKFVRAPKSGQAFVINHLYGVTDVMNVNWDWPSD